MLTKYSTGPWVSLLFVRQFEMYFPLYAVSLWKLMQRVAQNFVYPVRNIGEKIAANVDNFSDTSVRREVWTLGYPLTK